MPKRLLVIFTLIAMLIIACTTETTPPPTGVVTTPVQDLLVNDDTGTSNAIPTAVPQSVIDEADAEYLLLSNIYERVKPSVVSIETERALDSSADANNLTRGSGFIYDTDGHIITNAHVVSQARTIRVTFHDGYVVSAQLVGFDNFSDLAVLKVDVDMERLRPLLLGDSDTVRVGQRAIAIGNPFGLSSSMSVGIISGLGRSLRSAELIDATSIPGFENPDIIQTDTPINPGNSGGPLLNSEGKVVGVNTAIRTENGVFQGVGFAVPIRTVKRVVPELIDNGVVDYAWIGISVMPEENGFSVVSLAEALELPVDSGVLIRGITENSPADNAGLRGGDTFQDVRGALVCTGGDIVIAIDGNYIQNMDELVSYLILETQPDDTITLLVVRGRDTFEIPVTLQSRPSGDTVLRDCEG